MIKEQKKVQRNTNYTAFKSKWQILNLCCLKTTGPNPFRFLVDIGNNWPFCYAKTQISLLNSFGSIKQWKVPYFDGWIFFFPRLIWANLSLSTYKCPRNWARTLRLVSIDRKFFRNYTLARNSKKKSHLLWGYHWFLTVIVKIKTQSYKNHWHLH